MKGKTKEQATKNLIQVCVVGSRLYGVATADSDWDIRGVYLMPLRILLSPFEDLGTISFLPQEDTVFYPLNKFMVMCLSGNPNIIEMLFARPPMSIYTPAWEMIWENRSKFISARWVDSMLGFARSEKRSAGSPGSNEKQYRAAYHYLRMLCLAKTIITKRELEFPLKEYRDLLIAVRNKDIPMQEVFVIGQEFEKEIDLAMEHPWFPPYPDEETIEELSNLYMRACLYRQRLNINSIAKLQGGTMAVVLPCSCDSPFQDQLYGKGMRLHNIGKEESGGRKAVCTVCGSVKHIPAKSGAKTANEPDTPERGRPPEKKRRTR